MPISECYDFPGGDVPMPESKDEYFRKIIEARLDEHLVIPAATTFIRAHAFEYLNSKGLSTDVVCPLLELPEGNKISIGGSAFQYARIKKIIVPSDNKLNGTYIFANNKNLEELIWKSNSAAFNMCSECTNDRFLHSFFASRNYTLHVCVVKISILIR